LSEFRANNVFLLLVIIILAFNSVVTVFQQDDNAKRAKLISLTDTTVSYVYNC